MSNLRPAAWAIAASAVLMLAAFFAGWRGAQPPRALPSDAPETLFSGARAHAHSAQVGKEMHAGGTQANGRVRDYLVETLLGLGLEAEVQRIAVNHGRHIAEVENVFGRIKGTDSTMPFMITAHYDSVPTGPGAADDGSGTVVMLEAARALMQLPRMRQDIVFAFTSNEEGSGDSARATLGHPWLQGMNAVLGLEARGTYGPAFMFETSEGNGDVIAALAASGAPSIANSLMYEVHHRTPNETDFGTLKRNGALGLNVAFVGGLGHYHTENDNPKNLCPDSLQHQGDYVMALARHFGDTTIRIRSTPDVVFFNLLGGRVIHYSVRWVPWITAVAVLLFLLALGIGKRCGLICLRRFALDTLLAIAAVILGALLGLLVMYGSYQIFDVYITYNAGLYQIACLLGAAGLAMPLFLRLRTSDHPFAWQASFAAIWAILLLGLQFYLPVGAFAPAWPLISIALGLLAAAACHARGRASAALLAQTIASLPALLALVPGLYALHLIGAAFTLAPISALFVAMLGLFMPVLAALPRSLRTPLPFAACAGALVALVYAMATNGPSPERPQMASLSYAMNADTRKALWLSDDEHGWGWTEQFFRENAAVGPIHDAIPGLNLVCLHAPAPAIETPQPQISVLRDDTVDGRRHLTLRYHSPQRAAQSEITVLAPQEVFEARYGGEMLHPGKDWRLAIAPMPLTSEATLSLVVPAGEPLRLRILETDYGLPPTGAAGYAPMPPHVIIRPNTLDWWNSARAPSNRMYLVKEFAI